MSRSPIYPRAGRYDGADPNAAKAFRESQRNFQRFLGDPVIKITGNQTKGGCYTCEWYIDRLPLDPTAAGSLDLLAGRTKQNGTYLAVNTNEQGANTHTVPANTVTHASLQYRGNGDVVFFFQY